MVNKPEPQRVQEIFQRFHDREPVPAGELQCDNPFTLLVAVVLSAQATDVSVNRVTEKLFKDVQTPQDLLDLGEDRLREAIKTIGLYKAKTQYLIGLSRALLDRFQGEVPCTLEELITLPGVGRKTANVVLNTAFAQDTVAVDTHVFRVAHRLGLSTGATPLKVEMDLLQVVPKKNLKLAHLWLILHGRYICKARVPLCSQCFLTDICPYYEQKIQEKK